MYPDSIEISQERCHELYGIEYRFDNIADILALNHPDDIKIKLIADEVERCRAVSRLRALRAHGALESDS